VIGQSCALTGKERKGKERKVCEFGREEGELIFRNLSESFGEFLFGAEKRCYRKLAGNLKLRIHFSLAMPPRCRASMLQTRWNRRVLTARPSEASRLNREAPNSLPLLCFSILCFSTRADSAPIRPFLTDSFPRSFLIRVRCRFVHGGD